MINVMKLKGKITEKDMNVESLAQKIGINKSTLYRKLNGGGEEITIGEATMISKELSLSAEEVTAIFFTSVVA